MCLNQAMNTDLFVFSQAYEHVSSVFRMGCEERMLTSHARWLLFTVAGSASCLH